MDLKEIIQIEEGCKYCNESKACRFLLPANDINDRWKIVKVCNLFNEVLKQKKNAESKKDTSIALRCKKCLENL